MVEGERDCALLDVGESAEEPPLLTASRASDWDGRGADAEGVLGLSTSGTLAERRPIFRGEVQGGAEITIFFLELRDALLEGLLEKERERGKMFEIRRDTDIEMSGTTGPEGKVRGPIIAFFVCVCFRRFVSDSLRWTRECRRLAGFFLPKLTRAGLFAGGRLRAAR